MTVLRAARSTDAGTVGGILSEFAKTTDWLPRLHTGAEDIAHVGEMIARGWVTVAERDNRVVGFIACNGAEIVALYVAQLQRGQGVGSDLLNNVCARHPKLSLWTFQANAQAIEFYRRHGFVELARTDGSMTDEKLPDAQLEWQREAA